MKSYPAGVDCDASKGFLFSFSLGQFRGGVRRMEVLYDVLHYGEEKSSFENCKLFKLIWNENFGNLGQQFIKNKLIKKEKTE